MENMETMLARMPFAVEWADGTVDMGETPEAVLAVITKTQWTEYTPDQMRYVLSDRAWSMYRSALDPTLPLPEFFREMENIGMCRIIKWEKLSKEGK
jgi:hypothetical protein